MSRSSIPREFVYMLNCKDCNLCKSRTQVVVGRGPLKGIRYMFIGEAPGENEDETGMPFVGKAGQLLSELMYQAGLEEKTVYVTNVVKCRPPDNRPPSSNEVKQCSVHLQLQIKTLKPRMLVLIGNTALQYFFPKLKIMGVHGKTLDARLGLPVFPIIHPAASFRREGMVELILQDLKKLAGMPTDYVAPVAIGPRVMRE